MYRLAGSTKFVYIMGAIFVPKGEAVMLTSTRGFHASLAMELGQFAYRWAGRVAWVSGLAFFIGVLGAVGFRGERRAEMFILIAYACGALLLAWTIKHFAVKLHVWGRGDRSAPGR